MNHLSRAVVQAQTNYLALCKMDSRVVVILQIQPSRKVRLKSLPSFKY